MCAWGVGPEGIQTREVDSGRGGDMLQVRLGQTNIAGAAQAKGAHALREGAFNPRASGIPSLERGGRLPGPCGLEGKVLGAGTHFECPWPGGRAGALRARGTRPAVVRSEPDVNDGMGAPASS